MSVRVLLSLVQAAQNCCDNRVAVLIASRQYLYLYLWFLHGVDVVGKYHPIRANCTDNFRNESLHSAFHQFLRYFISETCVPHDFSWGIRFLGLYMKSEGNKRQIRLNMRIRERTLWSSRRRVRVGWGWDEWMGGENSGVDPRNFLGNFRGI